MIRIVLVHPAMNNGSTDFSSIFKGRHYVPPGVSWKYLYRAVDKQGNTVDFLLSEHRDIDIDAAKRLFTQATNTYGVPEKIPVDGYAATHTAIDRELQEAAPEPNQAIRPV